MTAQITRASAITDGIDRDAMRSEIDANIGLLDDAAKALEEAEIEIRDAFEELGRLIEKRNKQAVAYCAGVRNLNRMLLAIKHARDSSGDPADETEIVLRYIIVEPGPYATIEWPEDQWPPSDLIDPEAFDLDEIVG